MDLVVDLIYHAQTTQGTIELILLVVNCQYVCDYPSLTTPASPPSDLCVYVCVYAYVFKYVFIVDCLSTWWCVTCHHGCITYIKYVQTGWHWTTAYRPMYCSSINRRYKKAPPLNIVEQSSFSRILLFSYLLSILYSAHGPVNFP